MKKNNIKSASHPSLSLNNVNISVNISSKQRSHIPKVFKFIFAILSHIKQIL